MSYAMGGVPTRAGLAGRLSSAVCWAGTAEGAQSGGHSPPQPPISRQTAQGLGCGGEGAAGGGILPCWSCVGAAASAEPGWCQPGAGGGKGPGCGAAGDGDGAGAADGTQGIPPPVAGR